MMQNTYQLPLSFEQVLNLVRQLPISEQIKLSQEINKNLSKQTTQYRSQTFKHLMESVQPVSANFDSRQAKDLYLKEKYNL